MAGLYEQAIVEAKQLAEAALEHAKQVVIEKHAKDIEKVVKEVLDNSEKEDDEMLDVGAEGLPPAPAAPSAPGAAEESPAAGMGADMSATELPDAGATSMTDEPEYETPSNLDGVPLAATTDDQKEYLIDFKTLKASMEDELRKISDMDSSGEASEAPLNVDQDAMNTNAQSENAQYPIDLKEDKRSGITTPEETRERIIKRDPFIHQPIPVQKTDSFDDEDEDLPFDFEDEDEEEFDFDEERLEENSAMGAGSVQGAAKPFGESANGPAAGMGLGEESLEEIELEEELEVDHEKVPSGQFAPRSPLDAKHEMLLGDANKKAKEGEKKEKDDEEEKDGNEKLQDAIEELKESKKALQKHNKKLEEVLKDASNKLLAANLMNAKLLYTNRALRNDSLNERQKSQLAEAVSKATTVEEAKKTYEMLQEGLQSISSKNKKDRSLTELVSSKNKSLSILRENQDTIENPAKERMQILAGLKRTK